MTIIRTVQLRAKITTARRAYKCYGNSPRNKSINVYKYKSNIEKSVFTSMKYFEALFLDSTTVRYSMYIFFFKFDKAKRFILI